MQIIATNKKANHDYLIKEKYEAGLVLTGSEVKSLRVNTGSIKESHIYEKKGELWLSNCFIKSYSSSNSEKYETTRIRKILVNKREFNKIIGLSKKDGMTIIPLLLYFYEKGTRNDARTCFLQVRGGYNITQRQLRCIFHTQSTERC